MRAGKAYISSLGTTGLLIASSLLLLAVAGAFFAFDRWPDHAAADSEVVPIAPGPAAPEALPRSPESATRAPAGRGGEAAAGRAVRGALAPAAEVEATAATEEIVKTPVPADPVIANVPASGAAPVGDVSGAPRPSAVPAPEAAEPVVPAPADVVDALPAPAIDTQLEIEDVTTPAGDAVAPVNQSLGDAVVKAESELGASTGG